MGYGVDREVISIGHLGMIPEVELKKTESSNPDRYRGKRLKNMQESITGLRPIKKEFFSPRIRKMK